MSQQFYEHWTPTDWMKFHQAAFADPSLFSDGLKQWVPNWSEQNIQLSVDQLVGYQQFSASAVTAVITEESSSSNTAVYGPLTTRGPFVTGLPDGKYRIDWGAAASTNNSQYRCKMGVSVDGAQPDPTIPVATVDVNNPAGCSSSFVYTLSGLRAGAGGHTLECLYLTNGGGTGIWSQRYMTVHQVSGQ